MCGEPVKMSVQAGVLVGRTAVFPSVRTAKVVGFPSRASVPGKGTAVADGEDALQNMARSMRQHGTRSRRAASHPGSQHVDLAAWRERVEAVLDQPPGRPQASQRPPRTDHVEVDIGAVAGEDVAKVLIVPERQGGEIVEAIASTSTAVRV